MTTQELLLCLIAALLALVLVRRYLRARSIRQYLPTEVAEKLRAKASVILLDVRTESERNASRIKESIHIPLQRLQSRIEDLQKYQSKEIICYCQTRNRSLAAAALLKRRGYTVANMKGGITEWNFLRLRM